MAKVQVKPQGKLKTIEPNVPACEVEKCANKSRFMAEN